MRLSGLIALGLTTSAYSLALADEQDSPKRLAGFTSEPIAYFREHCPSGLANLFFPDMRCKPEQFAYISENRYYATYAFCLKDGEKESCDDKALVLFHAKDPLYRTYDDKILLTPQYAIRYDESMESLQQPTIISSIEKQVLLVRFPLSGTARTARDFVFEVKNSYDAQMPWLNTGSWFDDIEKPPKFTAIHGGWVDYSGLTTTVLFHREKDANCCPTGGTTQVKFLWDGDQLKVQESHFMP